MGKIRLLSFQSCDLLGGTELMNYSIISRMDRGYFDVDVCFLDNEGPLTPRYEDLGVRVFHLFADRRLELRSCLRLARILSRNRYDIMHVFGLRANLVGRLVGRAFGVRHIVTGQRNVDSWRRRRHVLADRLTSPLVSLYVSNSRAGADRLVTEERIPPDKIVVIHNGMDWSRFALPHFPGPVRRASGVPADVPVIVCVAEFRSSKGHHHLLDAADLLRSRGKKFRLWLVGDGELRQSVEHRIAQLGLGEVVTLLGVRADIAEILAESDVFCLPSLWEGLPRAIMEAMSAGLPVVATAVGGVRELVRDGDTGLVVPPREPSALALALERLVGSSDMRRVLGAAGRGVIRREFDLDDKVHELEEVYQGLVSQNGDRP